MSQRELVIDVGWRAAADRCAHINHMYRTRTRCWLINSSAYRRPTGRKLLTPSKVDVINLQYVPVAKLRIVCTKVVKNFGSIGQ